MKEAGWYRTGFLLGLCVRLWRRAVRLEVRGREFLERPAVLALWHGRAIGLLMDRIGTGGLVMTSRSKDGALATGALAACGIGAARGSSSRGGAEALTEMGSILAQRGATWAALTVDGPRGPWRVVKPGTVTLARRLGIPIVPASFSCSRPKLLRSWDRMVVPKPGSRVVAAYGPPIDAGALPEDIQAAVAMVGKAIDALGASLDLEVLGAELWPGG